MSQEHMSKRTAEKASEHTEEQVRPIGEAALKSDALDQDVDELLAEIDDVLEENAEEFVKTYIQKGGQ